MENSKILFEFIKEHKWDEFIKYIKENEHMDVNMRDISNNYLINYAILFNKIDAVSLLIHSGSKLDITDNEGRSILYVPIKYGFLKILNLLLHFNKTNIGISLIDIKDKNNNIPIHYAIQSKNIDAVKMLLEYDSDVNERDNNGLNSLHLAIINRSYEMTELILEKNININSRTNTGETALHIACNFQLIDITKLLIKAGINVNIQDYDHEFTALDYSISHNNTKLVKLLIENDANPNNQDFFGQTPLHYTVKEENQEILHYLISSKYTKGIINYNLYNVDAQLPIHILLEKDNTSNVLVDFLNIFVENSDLNFQDTENTTPLMLIVKKNLWKGLKDILKIKKMDIFLIDYDEKRAVDYVKREDLDEFLDMVTDSYLYILRNRNFVWKEEWENMCKEELKLGTLKPDEKKSLQKYIEGSKLKKTDDVCKTIIRNKLEDITKNKISKCGYTSYPFRQKKRCIAVRKGEKIEVCTFTGITMDILFGLIYLLRKHPNACSTLDETFADNTELCSYYKSIGISKTTTCEFLNFEIMWIYQKIYFSSNFRKNFQKCKDNKDKDFIIIPLGIELREGSHANYLIYDKNNNAVERFEPYGAGTPYRFDYNPNLLDNILKYKFTEIDENIKYIKPSDYMPKIGFQYFDILEKTGQISDPGGFCALWGIWFVDNRITYFDIERESLVRKLMKSIREQNISFKNLIRNYSKNIIDIRDQVLNGAGITINDWLNDQYTEENYKKIVNEITKLIMPLI